jgi:uncharacterized membrane protein
MQTLKRSLLPLVLILSALISFSLLDRKSLWFDEAFSVWEASKTLNEIWSPASGRPEAHPPLYYTGLHYWIRRAGDSEATVRVPSAAMALLNVSLLYLLGRRLLGHETGLLAAALLSFSPLHVWYAQEARMYIFVTGAGLFAALLLTWRSWWSLPLLALTLVAGFYTDYTMLPLWTGLSAVWLAWWVGSNRAHKPLIIWLAATVTAILAFSPLFSELTRVLRIFDDLQLFVAVNIAVGLPFFSPATYMAIMILAGVVLFGAALIGRRVLTQTRPREILTPLVVGLYLLMTLGFLLPRLFSLKRVLVMGWPYVALLVAWLLIIGGRQRRLALWLTVSISVLAALMTWLAVPKDDWRGAVAHVHRESPSGAITLVDPYWNELAVRYYAPQLSIVTNREFAPNENAAAQPGDPFAEFRDLPESAAGGAGDVWLIAERLPGGRIPSSASEAWLDQNMLLVERVPFYRLEVRRYRAASGD